MVEEAFSSAAVIMGSREFENVLLMFVKYKLLVVIFLVNPHLACFYLLLRQI